MRKPLSLALSVVALVMTMLPVAATAAPPASVREHLPEGGCPTGWSPGQPTHAGGQALDWNEDTWLCRFDVPSGGFVLIDNVVQHTR